MSALREGLYITVLGISVVFAILSILAVILYAVGWIERRLVAREKRAGKAAETGVEAEVETEAETKVRIEKEVAEPESEAGVPPHEVAIITAAILAYMAKKAEEMRPVPIRRKVSDAWRLQGGEWLG
ncbi:MAG: OadG family protein [Thermococci archaeon]|nr:OadG family protein [Thermococci archaeon]